MPRKPNDLCFTQGAAGRPTMPGLWVVTPNQCWASCQLMDDESGLQSVLGPVHLLEPILAIRPKRTAPWFHHLVIRAKMLGYVVRFAQQWPLNETVEQNQRARQLK